MAERIAAKAKHGQDARDTKVAFFPGCIGSVMFEKVNRQAVELLAACGAEVVVPRTQVCCGAIHHHNGVWEQAVAFAKRNIDALLPKDGPTPDYIATNIAGCGAMLKDYDHLLRDDPAYADRAKAFAAKVKDISEVIDALGLPEMKHRIEATVTYHDACHLAHAQKVTAAPRKLLAAIPGLKIVPLQEADMCCGAAGTYNLTQPEMATQLAERKLRHIGATKAAVCVTGNVGCAMQIQSEADARGQSLDVVHPVELLHRAVFGKNGE
jgi:glycolate oxidase iron-sulfur subunit